MNVLITGAKGFIGSNLTAHLRRRDNVRVLGYDQDDEPAALEEYLAMADVIFHLAGVNRPQDERQFHTGNVDLTRQICERLPAMGSRALLVLSSSIQAAFDNPYGRSKRQAEEVVAQYAGAGGRAVIYRLKNVFGKWCRPNYNSVVATFCHNIAHDLPITISDPGREVDLVHIDDVVRCFSKELTTEATEGMAWREVGPSFRTKLGELAGLIRFFKEVRHTLILPDLSDEFTHKLYGTYLSYLDAGDFAYALEKKCDPRGCLAEFVKGPSFGQIFVSRTLPGITRGNHYHHTKAEKFLVLQGEALIRFRSILGGEIIEYPVRGEDFRVVDIPPGYTHSIENVGQGELVTLFWANEIFDAGRPDTEFLPVKE
jgi:UDP-2-acetamido-2,6-beta-L-arabino-hexul-4-ose reductase